MPVSTLSAKRVSVVFLSTATARAHGYTVTPVMSMYGLTRLRAHVSCIINVVPRLLPCRIDGARFCKINAISQRCYKCGKDSPVTVKTGSYIECTFRMRKVIACKDRMFYSQRRTHFAAVRSSLHVKSWKA